MSNGLGGYGILPIRTPAQGTRAFPIWPSARTGAVNRTAGDARSRTAPAPIIPPAPPATRPGMNFPRGGRAGSATASSFNPFEVDWAAEGGGSRRPTVTTSGVRATPGLVDGGGSAGEGSTGPQVTDVPSGGTTDGVSGGTPYPTVLPPLTPEMQSALDARRRAASRAYEEAAIQAEDERIQAEAQRLFTERQIDEAIAAQRRQGMSELASRGVARSPLFANPFRRELVRQQQQQLGQAEATLAGTLDQLGRSLQAAELQREREYADIGLAAMQARSNLGRILGTA